MARYARLIVSLAVLVVIAAATATARADTISVTGNTSGAASTATVVGEFNSQTNTFTFTATNTSAITQPGSTSTVTAFGFDLPPEGNAVPSGLNGFTGSQAPSLSSNFTFSDADVGNVQGFPASVLDFAFITGISGNFSGGSVNDGLLPGESASFTISGVPFTGFTEGQITESIFVRFENVQTAAGSDVAVFANPSAVPEPSAIALLSGAVIGLAAVARRVRRVVSPPTLDDDRAR